MIGHRVQDDGVLVTLKQSWGLAYATITESQAKRFAWGVLADLDPDGVERLSGGSAHMAGAGVPSRKRAAAMNRVKPPVIVPFSAAHDADLVRLYNQGGLTFTQIGKELQPRRTRGSVAGRVDRLRRKGLIT